MKMGRVFICIVGVCEGQVGYRSWVVSLWGVQIYVWEVGGIKVGQRERFRVIRFFECVIERRWGVNQKEIGVFVKIYFLLSYVFVFGVLL